MDKQYSIDSLSQEQLNLISNEDRVLNAVAGVLGNMQTESSINPRALGK